MIQILAARLLGFDGQRSLFSIAEDAEDIAAATLLLILPDY